MKKYLALVLAFAMLLSLAGCGGGDTNTTAAAGGNEATQAAGGETQPAGDNETAGGSEAASGDTVKGGTFVIGAGGSPSMFNPDYRSDDNLYPIAQNIFNRLIKLTNYDTVIPDLAESYEFSEDGKTLTFHLHEGVKWHDGVDFSSEDVKWTYDTMMEEQWFKATVLESVESIECPDANTVVFNLTVPDVTIVSKLGWYGTFILPKHLYEGQDAGTCDAATKNPVGTGPFKFESYEVDVATTLVKNEEFWGDEPNPDKLIFAIYKDEDAGYQAWLNGEVDYLYSVPVANTGDQDNDPDYRVFEQIWQNRTYVTFNFEDPDFGKVEVRRAVQLAIDRPGLEQRVGGGTRFAADYYVSPVQTDYVDENYKQPDRDLEEAMRLLESAGYTKDADGFYLHATIDVFESGYFGDMAQVIKANLAEIGIDLTVNMLEYAAWVDKVQTEHNFSITALAGYQGPDISGLAGRIQTGASSNVGGYSNERVDELLALSNVEPDTAKRAEYFSEIQKIMDEDVPMVLLLENGAKYPVKNSLVGTPYDLPEKAAASEFTYLAFAAE